MISSGGDIYYSSEGATTTFASGIIIYFSAYGVETTFKLVSIFSFISTGKAFSTSKISVSC